MKRIVFFLFFPVVALAQKTNPAVPGFTITGKVAALPENSVVYLAGSNENDTIAKARVKQQKFVLKGEVEEVDSRMLVFPSAGKRMFLFMGNDAIKISSDEKDFSDVVVTGSQSHADYEEFLYELKPLNDFVEYYRGLVQSAPSQGAKDSAAIMLNTAYNMYQNSIDRFIARKKNSPVSTLLLAYSYDMDPNKDILLLEKRFKTLGEPALENRYARSVGTVIMNEKATGIGTVAKDFVQPDTSGNTISLSQFRGKYVLVDFWASWCGPCRRENPNIVAAYKQFKDKNFTILGVSLDQLKTNWLWAINKDHLTWTHVSDLQYWNNAAAQLYHIQSIPQNILVDPNGVIVAKNLRGEELASKLSAILQ